MQKQGLGVREVCGTHTRRTSETDSFENSFMTADTEIPHPVVDGRARDRAGHEGVLREFYAASHRDTTQTQVIHLYMKAPL